MYLASECHLPKKNKMKKRKTNMRVAVFQVKRLKVGEPNRF